MNDEEPGVVPQRVPELPRPAFVAEQGAEVLKARPQPLPVGATCRITSNHLLCIGTVLTVDEEKEKVKGYSDELSSNRQEMESFSEARRSLQNALRQSENNVLQEQEFNQELHSNLEDLFADMCSLAQIHQHSGNLVESAEEKAKHEIAAANEKLDTERKKSSKLDDKVKLLEEENDKLYRKLAKYKERLEQERKERKEEEEQRRDAEHRRKRNGPVSYLNSLHTSNISDVSRQTQGARQTQSTRDYRTSHRTSRDKSKANKENASTSYYTNASQLRSQYK